MTSLTAYALPQLQQLPLTMPQDGSISIDLKMGTPVFRASTAVQERISFLLHKNKTTGLNTSENDELDNYEEIDDYLSHLNRVVRNLQTAN